ncbi:MAG: purine-nucleoside phosphorylase [Planctomycetota bacterium]
MRSRPLSNRVSESEQADSIISGTSVESAASCLGVVMGSGLGGLAERIQVERIVPYTEIDGMGESTTSGHRGEFLVGTLAGRPVLAMAGRLHAYEGHPRDATTLGVRLMAAAGVDRLLVSCAAGGLNPLYEVGDLAVLTDHMSWQHGRVGDAPSAPLGSTIEPISVPPWNPLQRTMATCDPDMQRSFMSLARALGATAHTSMYLSVSGPNYETRAECRMMRRLGVDLVGMSTVPELVGAARLGLRVLGIAVVTNVALPDAPAIADHADVLEASEHASESMQEIVMRMAMAGD